MYIYFFEYLFDIFRLPAFEAFFNFHKWTSMKQDENMLINCYLILRLKECTFISDGDTFPSFWTPN